MFERFTDRARRVIVLAQEESRLLDHNYIGTEHVLLGLVHEGEGVAALALGSLGIYLGRFLRLNSWDALEHPTVLPRILHTVARNPFAYQQAIGVTVLFTLALGFAYFLLYNFAVVGRELDVER